MEEAIPGGTVTPESGNTAPPSDIGPITGDAPNIEATPVETPEPQPERTYTKSELAAWDHDRFHTEFKDVAAYNRAIKSNVDRQVTQVKAESAAQSARAADHNWWMNTTPEQRDALFNDPDYAAQVSSGRLGVRDYRANFDALYPHGMKAGPVGVAQNLPEAVVRQVEEKVFHGWVNVLKTHPELSGALDEDEFAAIVAEAMKEEEGIPRAARLLASYNAQTIKKGIKGIAAAEKAKADAKVNDETARFHQSQEEPDVLPPATSGSGLTLQTWSNMTSAERAKLPRGAEEAMLARVIR